MFSGPSLYLYYFNYTKKEQNVLISGNKRLKVLSVEDEGMTESKTLLGNSLKISLYFLLVNYNKTTSNIKH